MSEPNEPNEQEQPRKGGRPRLPDAPKNAEDCRRLLAIEVTKTTPHTARLKGLQTLLESFERSEHDQLLAREKDLAQSQADNAALQAELATVRDALAAAQGRCDALAVPHDDFEQVKAERDSLQRDLASVSDNLTQVTKLKDDAVTARDAAASAQTKAEQGERQAQQYVTDEFKKVIDPLAQGARLMGSSVDGREWRVQFTYWMEELKRLHAEAIATPVSVAPAPVKIVRQATPEERRKVIDALVEQERVENLQQLRSPEPSAYEHNRERSIPRTQESEPSKPISGGAEWSDWVK